MRLADHTSTSITKLYSRVIRHRSSNGNQVVISAAFLRVATTYIGNASSLSGCEFQISRAKPVSLWADGLVYCKVGRRCQHLR
jgi:hypothetical protein